MLEVVTGGPFLVSLGARLLTGLLLKFLGSSFALAAARALVRGVIRQTHRVQGLIISAGRGG